MESYANPQVLEFYKTLPFNYYESIEKQSEAIVKDRASLSANAPIVGLMPSVKTVLDVGCGAGWLANLLRLRYPVQVTGIDFNPVAIERAQGVARHLNLETHFFVQDLFTYFPKERFDLVSSLGVLHHTDHCLKAIEHIAQNCVADGGHLYVGLYHKYGRRPFLDYFETQKKNGLPEETLFYRYAELHSQLKDQTHLRSWFRDQVLHPHETQHTLKETMGVIQACGFRLVSTSINRFEPIRNMEDLYELEKTYEAKGKQALSEKRYFPGFFTLLAKREPK